MQGLQQVTWTFRGWYSLHSSHFLSGPLMGRCSCELLLASRVREVLGRAWACPLASQRPAVLGPATPAQPSLVEPNGENVPFRFGPFKIMEKRKLKFTYVLSR